MDVRCYSPIWRADGLEVAAKDALVYLGALISNDARISSEIGRRIGELTADFKALNQCWSHISLSIQEKLSLF